MIKQETIMKFYKKLFTANIIISTVYTFVFTFLVFTLSYSFSKKMYDTNMKTYIEYRTEKINNAISAAKNAAYIVAADQNVQKYASETYPDYPNRSKVVSFIKLSINSLLSDKCNITVTKYHDNHAISSNYTSAFDYSYKSKGFSDEQISNIIKDLNSQSVYNMRYCVTTINASSFLTIFTKHTVPGQNSNFYVLATYPLNSLFDFDEYNNIIVPFATINNKIAYIKNSALTDVANEYISMGKSKYNILSYTPDTKNVASDITYHFIVADELYYIHLIPNILLILLICIPIYIFGIIIMRKITNKVYQPISNLLSFLPQNGKTIENEFDFVLSEYHKLENISNEKSNLINQFRLSSKDKFILDLLFGRLTSKQIRTQLEEHNLQNIKNDFVVVIIEYNDFDILSKNLSRSGIYNLKTTVSSYFNELFSSERLCLITETSQNNHIIIISCDNMQKFKTMLQTSLLRIMSDLDIDIYAAIGDITSSYSGICDSYRTANELIRRHVMSFEHKVVLTTQDIKNISENRIVYLPDNEIKLISAVTSCESDKVSNIIHEIFDNNNVSSNEAFAQLTIVLYSTIQKILYNLNMSESEIFSKDTSVYLDLKSCKNLNSLKLTLTAHLNTIMSSISEKQNLLLTERASEMINFVNENFTKDISLLDLSEYMNMSQAHISRLFKSETGINFKEYIMQLRYQKAKEMLESNPNMMLKDVAAAVGYTNTKALSRLLKKYE